jgi:hypothetical protein
VWGAVGTIIDYPSCAFVRRRGWRCGKGYDQTR